MTEMSDKDLKLLYDRTKAGVDRLALGGEGLEVPLRDVPHIVHSGLADDAGDIDMEPMRLVKWVESKTRNVLVSSWHLPT